MFTDDNVRLIAAAATKAGIEPAALLAIVECETAGAAFESDGVTPTFLYERHIAWRESLKKSKAIWSAFVKAGLAIERWSRSTQYKDERTSKMKLALIARARAIHEEVANLSASWGLGQTMGNEFQALGFFSATDLVRFLVEGGMAAQIEVMIREIKSKRLVAPLNAHQWAVVARRYNGCGYAANHYDTRMAAAWLKWSRCVDRIVGRLVAPPEQALTEEERKEIQRRLFSKGYKIVGVADGNWGANTTAAVTALQTDQGLVVTGHYDQEVHDALEDPDVVKLVSKARAETTVDDLRQAGSRTIKANDNIGLVAKIKMGVGAVCVGGGSAQQVGLLGQAQDAADKAGQVKGLWEQVHGYIEPFVSNPVVILLGMLLLFGGYEIAKFVGHSNAARVDDHRSGTHNGNEDNSENDDA